MHTDAIWRQDEYIVSTERKLLDLDVIHRFLTEAYWSPGIPRSTIEQAIEHSLPFGLYHGTRQVGFARVITDYTTFAYIADVFVIEKYQGRGLSKWMMRCVMEHPDLQGLRRWTLFTRDAHGLYEKVGFQTSKTPERLMEQVFPNIYQRSAEV
ncbi:MAG TPA: GNAT family N-acetyltransferase [Ktedonobacteraceae bacterium]|nr:GNAT family N-acetyltransferase [Ktedonobacteraceae bacterium]